MNRLSWLLVGLITCAFAGCALEPLPKEKFRIAKSESAAPMEPMLFGPGEAMKARNANP